MPDAEVVRRGAAPTESAAGRQQIGYAPVVDDDEDESSAQRRRLKKAALKCLKFSFSTAGLLVLSTAYAVGGAFMFQAIERQNEIDTCTKSERNYAAAENDTLAKVMAEVYRFNGTPFQSEAEEDAAKENLTSTLRDFSAVTIDIAYTYGKPCSTMGEAGGRSSNWSWLNALFFTITVITTIGYGNFTPATSTGRLVCIFYAFIGIPILLAFLANLTQLMANVFRYTYAMFCCCGCLVSGRSNEEDEEGRPLDTRLPSNGGRKSIWVTDATGRPIEKVMDSPVDQRAASPAGSSSAGSEDVDDDDDDDDAVSVPLTISIVAMLIYVIIGAAVFCVIDERWTFVKAFYFAFVTTATIGFGDVVPEYGEDVSVIIINSIYMVLGIAMIGMAFQLMQDEFVAKIKWLSAKLGCDKHQKGEEESPSVPDENNS